MASPSIFEVVTLATPAGARAEVCPYGAQVLHWQPVGARRNYLYVSRQAMRRPGVGIRGGMPVIFPQFGLFGDLPKHGFARLQAWTLKPREHAHEVQFELFSSPATRTIWPHDFQATLSVHLQSKSLTVTLTVTNRSPSEYRYTAGLHTYLAIGDLAEGTLEGLAGLDYLDATAGLARARQDANPLRITTEIDRVYLAATQPVIWRDHAGTLTIRQQGFNDVVVWNPGPALTRTLPDMAAEDYAHFLCVEAASIHEPVVLAPGATWQASQTLSAA